MFWQNPPWQGGKPKYRLGLAPIDLQNWFPVPMTEDIAAHKSHLLATCYNEVTAVADDVEVAMTAQQALAAQRP